MYFTIFIIVAVIVFGIIVHFVVSAKISERRKQYDQLVKQIGGTITDSFDTQTETVSINPENHVFQNALPAGIIANLTTAEIDSNQVRIFDHYIKERVEWTEDTWRTITTTRINLRSKNLDLPVFEIVQNFSDRILSQPPDSIDFDERQRIDEAYKIFESKNNSAVFAKQYKVYSQDENEIKRLFDGQVAAYFRDLEKYYGFDFKNVIGDGQEIEIVIADNIIEPMELLKACRELAELLAKK